jgi:hypothetical protein
MDRPTRFIVAWGFAASEDEAAPQVVAQTRVRTAGQRGVPWVSDGKAVYRRAVAKTYRDPVHTGQRGRPALQPTSGVGLTQVVKHRQGRRLVKVEIRQVLGVAVAEPYTVHEERMNGVLRDRLACLTRKTHAFAKQSQTWDAAVMLALFEHNWLRPHPALREAATGLPNGQRYRRRSPAMAIGFTDHVWTWEEFLQYPVYQHHKE